MTITTLFDSPISGTLVEAQDGRVLAASATAAGAIFDLLLPASG